MVLRVVVLLMLCLIAQVSNGQTEKVDQIIAQIDFEEDTVKAVYDWVTSNIDYDVGKLKKISKSNKKRKRKQSSGKTLEDLRNERLLKVIKKKKGVCEDYSLLFDRLLTRLGYEVVTISGYTKNYKGNLNRKTGHVWNAVKVNGKWKLFDTTWGAGIVTEKGKYERKYNSKWYDVSPEDMVVSHMPYDPIWQLSSNPVPYAIFEGGTLKTEGLTDLDFERLIEEDLANTRTGRLQNQLDRSLAMGDGISLVDKWRKLHTKNIKAFALQDASMKYKEASSTYGEAVDYYNSFINAKRNRFRGDENSLEVAEKDLLKAKEYAQNVLDIYEEYPTEDKKMKSFVKKSVRQTEKLLSNIEKDIERLQD